METPIYLWLILGAVLASAIAVDVGVVHRHAQRITVKRAALETAAWIALALAFNLWIYFMRGSRAGIEFLTGYVVEKSLSVDNIFVFLLIFQTLKIPDRFQHRVLYYGVVGALVMRAGFVVAGVALLRMFHPVLYLLGVLLVLTGVRMLLPGKKMMERELKWPLRFAKRILPITEEFHGEKFWVRSVRGWNATPLMIALVVVELLDIVFAVDSVPAVLAVTRDTFIAYSSNMFAVLGLRAMYFALAATLPRFRFLHTGLAAILLFVGAKMLVEDRVTIPTAISLGIIVAILVAMVGASLVWPRSKSVEDESQIDRT